MKNRLAMSGPYQAIDYCITSYPTPGMICAVDCLTEAKREEPSDMALIYGATDNKTICRRS